jgi:hypothetical protein
LGQEHPCIALLKRRCQRLFRADRERGFNRVSLPLLSSSKPVVFRAVEFWIAKEWRVAGRSGQRFCLCQHVHRLRAVLPFGRCARKLMSHCHLIMGRCLMCLLWLRTLRVLLKWIH